MAFGSARGNHWLIIPGAGMLLMLAAWLHVLPAEFIDEGKVFDLGLMLVLVGIVLAGLIGHIVWLVPFALLFMSPLLLVQAVQDRYRDWRRKRRAEEHEGRSR